MVWGAVIFMPILRGVGKFRRFGLDAPVGEFFDVAKLAVVDIPEEIYSCGVVGGFGVGATGFGQSFPAFVGDEESGASILDSHRLLWVGGIDPDAFTLVEKQQVGAKLRIALWLLNQQRVTEIRAGVVVAFSFIGLSSVWGARRCKAVNFSGDSAARFRDSAIGRWSLGCGRIRRGSALGVAR